MKNTTRDAELITRAARRLALQFGASIALILGIVGVVVSISIDVSIRAAFEEQLESAVENDLPGEYTAGAPIAVVVDGVIRTTDRLPPGLPDVAALDRALLGEERITSTTSDGEHQYLVLTEQNDDSVVQAAVDVHEAAEERGRVNVALALGGVVGAAAAAFGAYFLARRAMAPLATALAKQRRFVADASHELRTPLTLLSTRVQMLRRKLGPETDPSKVVGEVGAIERDTQSLTRLLEDLLAAADERPIIPVRVDISALAHEAVAAARAQAANAGVRLDVTAEPSTHALATSQTVRQILTALLANALDHASSRVTVIVAASGEGVTVQVADDGEGFAAATDVFERFATHRQEADGRQHYGLGLSLVAEIVHRLGGTVRTRPDLAGGVVEVTLPNG